MPRNSIVEGFKAGSPGRGAPKGTLVVGTEALQSLPSILECFVCFVCLFGNPLRYFETASAMASGSPMTGPIAQLFLFFISRLLNLLLN